MCRIRPTGVAGPEKSAAVEGRERKAVRTGSWMGPPQGGRAPRVGHGSHGFHKGGGARAGGDLAARH